MSQSSHSFNYKYKGDDNQPVTQFELLERLINKFRVRLKVDLHLHLETLLDTQSEIVKGNNTFEIRQLKREAKEKLLVELSVEEINKLLQLQDEVIKLQQGQDLQFQVEVNSNNFKN